MEPATGPETMLTYTDYVRLPADGRRHEILGGTHLATPSPVPRHQRVSKALLILLVEAFESRRLGEVFAAPCDVLLSRHDIVVPDLFVVLRERLSIVREQNVVGAPDLVVEIGSPATQSRDLGEKLALYARSGVREYWVLPCDEDVVLQHVLEGEQYVLRDRSSGSITLSIVPELSLDVARVWPRG